MRLILIGPPGSGKGTQGRLLAKHFSVPHIATGELIREEISKRTPFGLEIEATVANGILLDDAVVIRLLTERSRILANGFVLDGVPRTLRQAELLLANETLTPIDGAVYFDLDDEIAVERLSGRLTCPVCERSYHIVNERPKVDGICDDDGTALIRRPEDTAAAISTRLRVFHDQTKPLLSFFEGLGLLIKVDASTDPTNIFTSTLSLLSEKEQ